ncbi:MAG: flagellar biosynthesis protein FlhF [Leptospirales bacterium]
MVIRTFEGVDMNEALRKVKKELGTEAVILDSRTKRPSGTSGEKVVVTAGLPGVDPPWLPAGESVRGQSQADEMETVRIRQELESLRETVLRFEREWGPQTRETVLELVRHVESLAVGEIPEPGSPVGPPVPKEMSRAESVLEKASIPEESRQELLSGLRSLSYSPSDLEDPARIGSLLQFLIARNIRAGGSFLDRAKEDGPLVCLFMGPTGVGKTTTVAKLAAGFTMKHQRKVRLVNLDTYRIGALEQLKIYGDLMGLPVDVAGTPERLTHLVSEASQNGKGEIVLVDSAGMSFGDDEKLKPFVDALSAQKNLNLLVSLVVSASSKTEDLSGALDRFQGLGPRALILTKVDETERLGSLYPFLSRATIPVCYVTTGQKVPDDIEVAHAGKLSQWILGGFR